MNISQIWAVLGLNPDSRLFKGCGPVLASSSYSPNWNYDPKQKEHKLHHQHYPHHTLYPISYQGGGDIGVFMI
jgi:hypothetical protein